MLSHSVRPVWNVIFSMHDLLSSHDITLTILYASVLLYIHFPLLPNKEIPNDDSSFHR